MANDNNQQIDIEEITEIGSKRAKALREAGYSTIEDIRGASLDELSRIKGVGQALAVHIKDELEHEFGGSRTTAERIERIRARWRTHDFERWYWIPRPARVRILIYADSGIKFDGGSFDGLTHVVSTLNADPWFWVRFDPVTVHRGTDPSADRDDTDLTDLALDEFDEIWFFGLSSGNLLSSAEINAVDAFMDDGGGVLVTGDHASLGEGIAGSIKRAGEMRKYPAPPASPGAWNTTLREGPTSGYQFADQSDDVPQEIRLRWYYSWNRWPNLALNRAPHPVLCGPEGPIDVFPDHQHEGEVNIPSSLGSDWPSKAGHQPEPEAVAWGRIVDPSGDQGREFPIVGVYDGHRADVGRIVADSTWHHWFDINLIRPGGFPSSPSGSDALEQFEAYFLNVAVWLAGEAKQRHMRNVLTWGALWRDPLVMIDPTALRPHVYGSIARDALGQFAPQCLVRDWLFEPLRPPLRVRIDELLNDDEPIPLPIEEAIMAEVIRPLAEEFFEQGVDIPDADDYPGDELFDEVYEEATERGLAQVKEYYDEMREELATLEL